MNSVSYHNYIKYYNNYFKISNILNIHKGFNIMNYESFIKNMREKENIKIEFCIEKRKDREDVPDYKPFSKPEYFYTDPMDEFDYNLPTGSEWFREPEESHWTPCDNQQGWTNYENTQVIFSHDTTINNYPSSQGKKEKRKRGVILNRYFTYGEQPNSGVFSTISNNKKFDFSYLVDCKSVKKKKSKTNPKLFTQDVICLRHKKTTVVIRCQNCNKTDHLSKDCPEPSFISSDENCYFCLSKYHKMSSCPNRPCLRCNRKGHRTSNCPRNQQFEKCDSCKHIGHLAEDCLSKPLHISRRTLANYTCYFCNKTGHLICPLTITNSIIDSDLENEVRLESLDDSFKTEIEDSEEKVKQGQIKYKKSCPKCAGKHSLKECGRPERKSKEDVIRSDLAFKYFSSGSKLINDKNFMNYSDSD